MMPTELATYVIDQGLDLRSAIFAVKVSIIREALKRTRGNQCKAARLLGIHRNTLRQHILECEEAGFPFPVLRKRPLAQTSSGKAHTA